MVSGSVLGGSIVLPIKVSSGRAGRRAVPRPGASDEWVHHISVDQASNPPQSAAEVFPRPPGRRRRPCRRSRRTGLPAAQHVRYDNRRPTQQTLPAMRLLSLACLFLSVDAFAADPPRTKKI